MRILLVSMNSIHFRRWTSQLEDSGHEVFWFDSKGAGGKIKELDWVSQHSDWRLRVKKARYTIKKIPLLNTLNERKISIAFEKYLMEVKPDVVHSFVLYLSCAPIVEVMKKYNHIKWIYSAWGNDLFFYQNYPEYRKEIDRILPHIDYMFADCQRDINLAYDLGFTGETLGVFPGGGGYHLDLINEPIKSISEREGILIKGYQGEKHRGLVVLKAIEKMDMNIPITFFSTDKILLDYYKASEKLQKTDITFYTADNGLTHKELCKKMNASLIYIGNNLSDGMPNTLLEAICFGAFPIQSNPGEASAEIISHGKNGLLIDDCEDTQEISTLIQQALSNTSLLKNAQEHNLELRDTLSYVSIRQGVLKQYTRVAKEIE